MWQTEQDNFRWLQLQSWIINFLPIWIGRKLHFICLLFSTHSAHINIRFRPSVPFIVCTVHMILARSWRASTPNLGVFWILISICTYSITVSNFFSLWKIFDLIFISWHNTLLEGVDAIWFFLTDHLFGILTVSWNTFSTVLTLETMHLKLPLST